MLMAEGMLKALSEKDTQINYQDCNDDYDFSEVLKFCGVDTTQKHKIRYADGQEKVFSFDKQGD